MKGKIVFLVWAMFIINVRYMRAQNINSQSSDVLTVDMRKQTSVAFVGTYYNSLGQCERLQEGRTRRRNICAFKVNQDLLGNIKVAEIEIASLITPDSLIDEAGIFNLIEGEQYKVFLNPEVEKLKYIIQGDIKFNYFLHLIESKEIMTITKMN